MVLGYKGTNLEELQTAWQDLVQQHRLLLKSATAPDDLLQSWHKDAASCRLADLVP